MLIAHGNGMMIIKTEDSRNTDTGIMPLQKQQLSLIGLCYLRCIYTPGGEHTPFLLGYLDFRPLCLACVFCTAPDIAITLS